MTPLSTRDELLAVTGPGDGFARWELPVQTQGWALGRTVAMLRPTHSRGILLTVWGPDVAGLVTQLLRHPPEEWQASWPLPLTVPRDQVAAIREVVTFRGGGEWDWMVTTSAPVAPSAPTVDADLPLVLTELDDLRDAEEISALAARENPRFEGYPGQGHSRCWLGLRDDTGTLAGCGALHETFGGVPHLAGILVADTYRGHGYGKALTAALTRRAIEESGVCTLGMYADNTVARALYHSLGYRTDKEWASGVALPLRGEIT